MVFSSHPQNRDMKEVRFFYVPDAAHQTALPDDEATHALRVLRLHEGDEMMLMDGIGNYYRAEVTLAHGHHCQYAIKETLPQEPQWQGHVHLAIAPTKMMDRMEWMLEKAVEVGVDEISFLDCQFSERSIVKMPRAEKIVIAATQVYRPLLRGGSPHVSLRRVAPVFRRGRCLGTCRTRGRLLYRRGTPCCRCGLCLCPSG